MTDEVVDLMQQLEDSLRAAREAKRPAVTIVSDDAERLVRKGGVVSWSNGGLPTNTGAKPDWRTPFTVEVEDSFWCRCGDCHPDGIPSAGTVRVVDVHHANDCPCADYHTACPGQRSCCDAEPDKWHLTVEPIGDADE